MAIKAAPESRKKIYKSLCYVLSDRVGQIAWSEFTATDWELFSQMAEREGVAPLMYWKLKDSPVEVPPSAFNFLRSTYYQTLAQNTLMYRELERILEALNEAGIPVIVLKGAALAATVYEDIGLRPMGDLDLLVQGKEVDQAILILTQLGFKLSGNPGLAPWLDKVADYHFRLCSEDQRQTIVELHWCLIAGETDWRSPPLEWFWTQTQPLVFPFGTKDKDSRQSFVSTSHLVASSLKLRPGAELLYQMAHLLLQHGRFTEQLLWFYDIHLLLSYSPYQAHLADLSDLAGQDQWVPPLSSVLDRVHLLFGTGVPGSIKSLLSQAEYSSPQSARLIRRKSSRLQTLAVNDFDRLLSLNFLDGLKYALATTFPSRSYMRWRYNPKPEWTWPLCYPYRWIRMLREVIMTLSEILPLSRD